MNQMKKNAITIAVLFIATMASGMIDAYFVSPKLASPIENLSGLENSLLTGVFSVLFMALGIVFIAIAFYPVIKRYSETMALTYVVFRAIEGMLLIVGAICYLCIIQLSGSSLASADVQEFVQLAVKVKYFGYQTAMITLGLGSLFLCYALFKSKVIPRLLSVWGGIGYVLLLLSAIFDIAGLIDTKTGSGALFYVPGGLWELAVLPAWLFVKGFRLEK